MRVDFTVTDEVLPRFCTLTGSGFEIEIDRDCTVRELLCGQLGVDADYVEHRIQTIFLNSATVDNPDNTIVTPGSSLALSTAMPGLAGAILRKDSLCATMRPGVTYGGSHRESSGSGTVTLQLFNMVQQELGAELLRRGIVLQGKTLGDLLERSTDSLRAGITLAKVDGRAITFDTLCALRWSEERIVLSVDI